MGSSLAVRRAIRLALGSAATVVARVARHVGAAGAPVQGRRDGGRSVLPGHGATRRESSQKGAQGQSTQGPTPHSITRSARAGSEGESAPAFSRAATRS
jgi:hypothetical protein